MLLHTRQQNQSINIDEEISNELLKKTFRLDDKLGEWEQQYIQTALNICGGNLSKSARLLRINRTTLYSRIQKLSINTKEQM